MVNRVHLRLVRLTICHDYGVFPCNSFVCNSLCEVDSQEHRVLEVAWSVGCFKKDYKTLSP